MNPKNLQAAEKALRAEGLTQDEEKLPKKQKMTVLLARHRLDLPDIAENIGNMAQYAEKEELRYKANELALKLHGVLNDDDGPRAPVFNIQINGDNVNLGFLHPGS
jgi:hypothetical protein